MTERAHISVQFLPRVEHGTANPSYLAVRAIARALGAQVEDLVREAR
jgi:predicted transcriptional regulator